MSFSYKGREVEIPEVKFWYPQTVVYDPLKVGSIDGTDIEPHDFGIVRAISSSFKPSYKARGNPLNTIFVGRLSLKTTEDDLERVRIKKHFCYCSSVIITIDFVCVNFKN